MTDSNLVLHLLSHWWAFGQPVSLPTPVIDGCRRVSLNQGTGQSEATFADSAEIIGWNLNVGPSDPPKATMSFHQSDKSHLDQWVGTFFTDEDYRLFEKSLQDDQTLYVVSLNSGVAIAGTLAELCWYRFYQLLVLRPNPKFFSLEIPVVGGSSADAVEAICDVQFLLPTLTGLRDRSQISSRASGIVLRPQQVLLFASLLPELFGMFRLTIESQGSAASLPRAKSHGPRARVWGWQPLRVSCWPDLGHAITLGLGLPVLAAKRLFRSFGILGGRTGLQPSGGEMRLLGPQSSQCLWDRAAWRAIKAFATSLEQRGRALG